jgi:flagellar assembly protein FliH
VAKKVVQQELQARPDIWLGMLRNAVRHTVDRERIVVRVPPALAAFLRASMPELRTALEDVKEVDVVEDPGLPQGGCVLESRFGEVDIGVETQLEAAEQALVHAED